MCALILLFVTVPIVELALLIELGGWIGTGPTIAIILLTGTLGAVLTRAQGLGAMRRAQEELAAGRMPADSLFDGLLILFAGAVLLTPGVLTDLAGFLCLVPPFRRWLRDKLAARFRAAVQQGGASFTFTAFGGPPPGAPGAGEPRGWPQQGRGPYDGDPGEGGRVIDVEARELPGEDDSPAT